MTGALDVQPRIQSSGFTSILSAQGFHKHPELRWRPDN